MIPSFALASSHIGNVEMGPVGATIFLLALAALGAVLAYRGYGFWRGSHSLPDPLEAEAKIIRLYRARWDCFAEVSFVDAQGNPRTTTIGVMNRIWSSLREGANIWISYSRARPERARFGGTAAQGIYAISGIGTMILGTGIALLALVLLIGGWAGWIDLRPFESHRTMAQLALG